MRLGSPLCLALALAHLSGCASSGSVSSGKNREAQRTELARPRHLQGCDGPLVVSMVRGEQRRERFTCRARGPMADSADLWEETLRAQGFLVDGQRRAQVKDTACGTLFFLAFARNDVRGELSAQPHMGSDCGVLRTYEVRFMRLARPEGTAPAWKVRLDVPPALEEALLSR